MINDPKRGLIYNPEWHESCVWVRASSCFGLCKTQEERDNYVATKCCAHPRHNGECVPVEAEGPKCEHWSGRSLSNLGEV